MKPKGISFWEHGVQFMTRPRGPIGVPKTFLAQHPDGYVQIEEPYAVSTDGMAATFWIAVASIALTPTRAQELGLQVDRSLCGLPYAPEPYKQTSPAEPTLLQTGVWLYRPTYERKTFIGLLAGG